MCAQNVSYLEKRWKVFFEMISYFTITYSALCVIFMILVSHENVKKCVLDGWPFASKSKINALFEKNSKNVDFSLWGNRATTQNTFFDIFMWDQNHENHT